MNDMKHHPRYKEEKEEIELSDITSSKLQYKTLDITYWTTETTTKTLRSVNARGPAKYNETPEGYFSFYEDGKEYAYNPEKAKLISINRNGQDMILAERNDIHKIEEITFKNRAKVTGAQQEGVEAEVYYRSNRSDSIKHMTVKIERIERAARMSGKDTGTGRRIEFMVKHERNIVSKQGTREYHLGKVTRVEFPLGHQFTLELEGVKDKQVNEDFIKSLKKGIRKSTRSKDIETINIEHNGRIQD